MKTKGNTILITGGSSGIGLAMAQRFINLDNTVIITGRDTSKLQKIKKENPPIVIFPCELTSQNSMDDLIVYLEQNYGQLNILINNAAIQYNYNFLEEQNLIHKIDYEINTNLTAPIKLTSLLLPTLIKNKDSAIINISSGLAISPKMNASVYCATKSAIHSYSKTLRYQLEKEGIKVFEIIPPLVATAMTEGRGKSKISPEELVNEFIKHFKDNRYESYIGKSKLLKLLHRVAPGLADRIMKNGL